MSLVQEVELWGSDIPWLAGLREKGVKAFIKQGLPSAKTEAWKYSYFKEETLNEPKFNNLPQHGCCKEHCHYDDLPFEAIKVIYCNGKLHGDDFEKERGLTIKPLVEAIYDGDIKPYLNKSFDEEKFPFAALNTAYLEQGLFIIVERGTVLEKPIFICYHNHGQENNLLCIRNVVVCESATKATVFEYFDGSGQAQYLQNVVNEFYIARDAELDHVVLQKESINAHHIVLNSVEVKENGQYMALCAQNGSYLSRQESYIKLLQKGAKAQVNGVYQLSVDGVVCDTTTNILHLAPQTYSDQLIKGVAKNAGIGVFQGQIHIAKGAEQCEGYQLHRALLLNDKAEIDCKPELEIFADDVKCSHGAASGDLDQDQLFYLVSRGIDEKSARQILIESYLDEVLNKITDSKIKNFVKQNF